MTVSVTGTPTGAPMVGAPVIWTAASSGDGATPVYQFRIGPAGGALQMVRDFSTDNTFRWNPLQQGTFTVQVTVKASFDAPTGETATASYTVHSRVNGPRAVVSPTLNPLVALYSAPPSRGSSMLVQFKPSNSTGPWSSTPPQAIVPGQSTNILVAGMLPNTTYLMRHVLSNGSVSPASAFRTGALPSYLHFPTFSVAQSTTPVSSLPQDIVFHVGINPPPDTANTVATDLQGNIVWYFDPLINGLPGYAPNVVPGGTILMLGGKQDGVGGADTLREIDLAGDTLRETNINAVSAELAALGEPSIINFNHEAQRLSNGDTVVLAKVGKVVDYQGQPTLYHGDMVLVLDTNFQVQWVWNPFQWLSTNRLPTLNEGAIDWMHANSISYSPSDGDLIVSMRAQDQVVKIDYANGTGDGHVIWTLGAGGDFTINSLDPSPWFSHQHDVRYINNDTVVLFDDGNTRQQSDPQAHSRGQELVLNEQTKQATLVVNADLGSYSPAMGSAQVLPNGNLDFGSPFNAESIMVTPDGNTIYVQQMQGVKFEYRSYIFHDMYGDPAVLAGPSSANPAFPTGSNSINLAPAFSRAGIVADGSNFGGGLDLYGTALSSSQVGSSIVAGGTAFSLGPVGGPNVVSAAGQVISLPAGKYAALKLLATSVNGAQPNQLFRVQYSNGMTARFRRSLSDWTTPMGFPGESAAVTTNFRNVSGGGTQPGQFHIYSYTLPLNPTKNVRSLILPVNANVEVFAASLVPVAGGSGSSNPTSGGNPRQQAILLRQAEARQRRLARQQAIAQHQALHPIRPGHRFAATHQGGSAVLTPAQALKLLNGLA